MAVLGGVNVNSGSIVKVDLERAKTAGAVVVRCEEHSTNKASLKEVAGWCAELGLKLDWICWLLEPKEKNETSKKTFVEQYAELTTAQKETLVLIELGNELWPGGAAAEFKVSGKLYAEWFCTIAGEFATAKIPVPLGLQVQLNPFSETYAWTEELGLVSHATLKKALEPTALLPTGNWIVNHPYGSKMTLNEVAPSNLESFEHGGSEEDPLPGGGKHWPSQRWMKSQQLIKNWTGLTVPMALTEFGARTENETGEEPYWKVASAAVQAEYVEALFAFARKAELGEVTSGPSGLVPALALVIWYDQYRSGKTESYGLMSATATPFEPTYAAFKEGVKSLTGSSGALKGRMAASATAVGHLAGTAQPRGRSAATSGGAGRGAAAGVLRARSSANAAFAAFGRGAGRAAGAINALSMLRGLLGGGEAPPLAHERILTALGEEMRDSLPPVLRESPDYLAVVHALAKEVERARATLELVRQQLNPATATLLLGVWERITRQTVAPVGKSEAERQAAITVRLRKMLSFGHGSAWEEQIDALVGPGWSYEENVPGEPSSPPAGTLRIKLPFPPSGSRYLEALDAIREVTHAHLEIEFVSEAGFLLDESHFDLEEMTV